MAPPRGSSILIVDDDADTRRLFRIILETEGYECAEASNAATAMEVVARGGIDLALVDVLLGEDDGLALTRTILEDDHDIAVVMVSGLDDADVAEKALRLGAYGYLLKPARRSALLLQVANASQRHELERRHRGMVAELERRVEERTAELQAALDRAEEADAVRSQFVQNVSHELRTPLTVILAGAALLPRTTEPEQLGAIADSIHEQSRRLLDLIDRLLEVASLDSSRGSTMERVDLRGLLALAAEPLRTSGRVVAIDVAGDAALEGSASRLGAAFGHLVDNAVRFTPPGTRVAVRAEVDDGAWVVRFADDGPGIDGAIRRRLWEPFVQGDGSTARTHGGLGVGLYLCRRLVEWHGGSVDAEDTPGGGLTVVIRLPAGLPR